jgi:hypothetical protein
MHCFLRRDTRITILEGPFTVQRGWVDSTVFRKPTGLDEQAYCYQATLDFGKWVTVRWDHFAPSWLNDDDLVWLLERLRSLMFPKT